MAMQDFVHLHVHSSYSMTDGASTVDNLAETAARLGQPALGLTDHGSVDGLYVFQDACERHGIQPVLGLEAYMTPGTDRNDPTRVSWDRAARPGHRNPDDVGGGGRITHLTLWAETNEGLANMMEASSIANLEGKIGGYPRMDRETIAAHAKGLICGSGCPSGAIQTRLRLGQFNEALREAGDLQDIFGRDNFYIELMDHGLEIDRQVRDGLLDLAKKLGAPLVATADAHQALPEDRTLQDVALCINSGQRMDDPERFRFDGDGYYLRPAEEMRALFADVPEACDNTMAIAERCRSAALAPRDPSRTMPKPVARTAGATAKSAKEELGERVGSWLKRSFHTVPDSVRRRIDMELGEIAARHMEGYLLAVADIVGQLRNDEVLTAPGDETTAGSLVAYALGITMINPLQHGVPYDGFTAAGDDGLPVVTITTERGGMRKVLEHLQERYGVDHALPVTVYSTFGSYRASNVVKKAFGNPSGKKGDDLDPIISGVGRLFESRSVSEGAIVLSAEPLRRTTSVTLMGTASASSFGAWSCRRMGLPVLRIEESWQLTVAACALCDAGAGTASWWDPNIAWEDGDTLRFLTHGDTIGIPSMDGPRERHWLTNRPVDRFDDLVALLTRNGMTRNTAIVRMMSACKVGRVKMTHPAEFLSNLVDELSDGMLSSGRVLKEIRDMGYGTAPVDINASMDRTVPVKGADGMTLIRMGLSTVPMVTRSMAEGIVRTRRHGGRFAGFMDFLHRLPSDCLDTRAIRALIEAGAFDALNGHRETLLADCVVEIAEERTLRAKRDQGQEPLFVDSTDLGPEF